MLWYVGELFFDVFELLLVEMQVYDVLCFLVQWVVCQDGSLVDDFCGYMGWIELGEVKVGDEIVVLLLNCIVMVVEIVVLVFGGIVVVVYVFVGQIVMICFEQDVDVLCGDMFVMIVELVELVKKFEVDLCWFDEVLLLLQCKYLLKQIISMVFVKIGVVKQVFDVYMLLYVIDCQELKMNDIGCVVLMLQKLIVCDIYDVYFGMGVFVLIDEVIYYMVVVGMICVFLV